MEEISKQMLSRFDKMENKIDELRNEAEKERQHRVVLENKIDELRNEAERERQHQIVFENKVDSAIKGLQETQTLALEMLERSMKMLQETRNLIDDKLTTKIAVEATIVNHESRIVALELVH